MTEHQTEFVVLDKKIHNRKDFDAGEKSLNEFFHRYADQNQKAKLSRTYVLSEVEPDKSGLYKTISFFTLSAGSVSCDAVESITSKKLPKYPVPVITLGQMAVDVKYKGQGLGAATLVQALKQAYKIHHDLGAYGVVLDCLNEDLKGFYSKYGFNSFKPDGLQMFLPMKTIGQLL